jgi:hypothetical protein
VAKTIGAALDALTAQLPVDETGTLAIVQSQRADQFFTKQQQERLKYLMEQWRSARDKGTSLSAPEESELKLLVDAELKASGERASALAHLE